jgi:NAD(P)-dependent dehydrogenase (short-subunit alcohol dehydrogenase family)
MYERIAQRLTEEQQRNIEEMHPLGLGTAADVAAAVAFLASDEARWITGTILTVDGGYTAQ